MDKQQFNAIFAAFLDSVRNAEEVTKRELGAMSITLIKGIHGIGDAAILIGELDYVNRLLPVLTPMHRKLLINYFKHFAGYNFDEALGVFTKKNKAHYMEALGEARLLLAGQHPLIEKGQPHNIWGWANHLKLDAPKVFNPEKVAKFVKGQVALATGAGLSKLDVLAAVFEGGFTADDVLALTEKMAAMKEAGDAIEKVKGTKLEDAPT